MLAFIPPRPAGALTGSQFASEVQNLPQPERDKRVLEQILDGNIPDFLRDLSPVSVTAKLSSGQHALTYFTMPDYLSIGSSDDFLRMPMSPLTAQAIGDAFGYMMPTTKMVDDTWRSSRTKVSPYPFNPNEYTITSVDVFCESNTKINEQIVAAGARPGVFVGGIKKDVVVTNQLATHPGKVAIYGWQYLNGQPIQPLSTVHDITYEDYSQCVRLARLQANLDGDNVSLLDVLKDPVLSALISDEGPIKNPRYKG
jgi:hypothetical protein